MLNQTDLHILTKLLLAELIAQLETMVGGALGRVLARLGAGVDRRRLSVRDVDGVVVVAERHAEFEFRGWHVFPPDDFRVQH